MRLELRRDGDAMNIDLNKVMERVSGLKLRGGVVGKVCAVLIVVSICLCGCALVVQSTWITAASMLLISGLCYKFLSRIIDFADRNPQAALLEGAEFLVHQRMTLGHKGEPVVASSQDPEEEEEGLASMSAQLSTPIDQPDEMASPAVLSPTREDSTNG